ncbi:MAG: hypothetical protein GF308_16435 [Candidatus Heimdallarchaeota archaeon]|nr:hypothetical protein [Candidatus Heimdallarchaeota archaeon]
MSLEDFLNISPSKKEEAVSKITEEPKDSMPKPICLRNDQEGLRGCSPEELRKDPLYKGRLAYLEEVIVEDCPEISNSLLAEKLDIPVEVANLLLNDYKEKKDNGHSKE